MNLDFDPNKNYYDILGVSESADADEIKKAYRKWAMKYHPDRNRGDDSAEEKFKEINEANEVLSDSSKKQQYDAFRSWWWGFGWFWWWGFGWGWFWGTQFWWVDLGDLIWGMFWWWGSRRGWPQRGDDLILQLTISFEDSYHGLKKDISYARLVKAEWVEEKTCAQCNGSWMIAQQVRTPFWVMQSQAGCPTCEGAGKEYYKDGNKLEHGGLEEQKESISVNIPAWIKSWSKIRYPGKGNGWLHGWPEGDLYIKILVRWSDVWRREGNHLLTDIDISIFDAVLWGEVEVKHPEGPVKVKIPKWLQVGENIRVSWKWFGEKKLLSSWGDMVVVPNIKIPKRLSKDQEKLWKELQEKKA